MLTLNAPRGARPLTLDERRAATQRTLDHFRDRDFSWRGATCLHVLRFHLRALGHRPPRIPPFRSPVGAMRALKAAGYVDLAALLDDLPLARLTPAQMIVGDIALVPGDDSPFDALLICAGGKFIGWHGAAPGFQGLLPEIGAIKGMWRG